MSKRDDLNSIVSALFQNYNLLNVSASTQSRIVESLLPMSDPSRGAVLKTILSQLTGNSRLLLESVDFGGSNYWIDQIVEILKGKK